MLTLNIRWMHKACLNFFYNVLGQNRPKWVLSENNEGQGSKGDVKNPFHSSTEHKCGRTKERPAFESVLCN